ncbi:hypothetical protein BTUL_0242g00140 [Botrytis tulipae]|uniref:Uncharacterized protein n=1 Tax=Botrytis tulipae TaxID=87230 RepID=A0A4Z1E9C4_9HELO|nr:hypothetical protein BTUL_0242g00140 [Botrytis tulipae]
MAAPVASKTKEHRKVITKDCSAAYGQYLLDSLSADDGRLPQIVTIKCIAVTCPRDELVQVSWSRSLVNCDGVLQLLILSCCLRFENIIATRKVYTQLPQCQERATVKHNSKAAVDDK